MRIDTTHRGWGIACLFITLLGGAAYAVYARTAVAGPRGGSVIGLSYGSLAAGMILFAWLLAARKKVVLLRVGSVTWWTRGHLWLGALSVPMAFYHGAFSLGGPLTTVLMVLLGVVVFSGVCGGALQHALPAVMTAQVTSESTYEQLSRLRWQRRKEAFERMAAVCGDRDDVAFEKSAIAAALGEEPETPKSVQPVAGAEELRIAYTTAILPFLAGSWHGLSPLAQTAESLVWFDDLRTRVDPAAQATVAALAVLCDEQRQQSTQIRLHRWLHGWLLLHIPLSMALVALMIVHAVMALYY